MVLWFYYKTTWQWWTSHLQGNKSIYKYKQIIVFENRVVTTMDTAKFSVHSFYLCNSLLANVRMQEYRLECRYFTQTELLQLFECIFNELVCYERLK